MDRRTLLAIALSFVVLVLWAVFFTPRTPPKPPAAETITEGAPAGALPEGAGAAEAARDEPRETAHGSPSSPAARREAPQEAPNTVVETDLVRVDFQNPGGRAVSWTLKRYRDYAGKPYELSAAEARVTGSAATSALKGKELQ